MAGLFDSTKAWLPEISLVAPAVLAVAAGTNSAVGEGVPELVRPSLARSAVSAAGSDERCWIAEAPPAWPGNIPVASPESSQISCVTMSGSPFVGRKIRSIRQIVTSWISQVTVTYFAVTSEAADAGGEPPAGGWPKRACSSP